MRAAPLRVRDTLPYRSGMEQIETEMKVCGKKRCRKVRAKVDTGAFGTIITRSVADDAGVVRTGGVTTAYGVGAKKVRLAEGEATVCAKGRCGCRRQKVYIAEDNAMGHEVLVGMDYLNGMRAVVDAATGKVRCRKRWKRSRSR